MTSGDRKQTETSSPGSNGGCKQTESLLFLKLSIYFYSYNEGTSDLLGVVVMIEDQSLQYL
jgi:hypothetical protein